MHDATAPFLTRLDSYMYRLWRASEADGCTAFVEALDELAEDFDHGKLSGERQARAASAESAAPVQTNQAACEAIDELRRTLAGVRAALDQGLHPGRAYECLLSAAALVRAQL